MRAQLAQGFLPSQATRALNFGLYVFRVVVINRSLSMMLLSDYVIPADLRRVIVSQQELQRLKVVENAVEGRLTVAEAAVLLGVGER